MVEDITKTMDNAFQLFDNLLEAFGEEPGKVSPAVSLMDGQTFVISLSYFLCFLLNFSI